MLSLVRTRAPGSVWFSPGNRANTMIAANGALGSTEIDAVAKRGASSGSSLLHVNAQHRSAIRLLLEERIIRVFRVLRRALRRQQERVGRHAPIIGGHQHLDNRLVNIHRIKQLADDLPALQIDHSGGTVIWL